MSTKKKTIRKKKGKPTGVTLLHPNGAKPIIGHDERLLEKRRMAYENRLNGLDNVKNAAKIQADLNLAEPIPVTTVSTWINEVYKERRGELEEFSRHEMMAGVENLKGIVQRFLPMALGKLHVSKMVETADGMVEVIDEKAYAEQIKAGDLVGKTIIRINDLLNGTSKKDKAEDNLPGGLKSFQLTVVQEIRQTIYDTKKTEGMTLTLEAGDSSLDR